jgi:hypothetical protein
MAISQLATTSSAIVKKKEISKVPSAGWPETGVTNSPYWSVEEEGVCG